LSYSVLSISGQGPSEPKLGDSARDVQEVSARDRGYGAMDPTDFAIFRFLSEGGVARFWGGRCVIDPRITPREVAERLDISESGVRARLHQISERGFLRDRCVVPNPALFGRRVFVADLPVTHSGEVDRMLGDLALVDGVIFTRDTLDEEQRKIESYFVSENDSSAARLAALLGRLSSEESRVVARPYFTPPCGRQLTPLDLRVLRTLWRSPEATFAELAEDVGISLKTAARIYHHLIESRACWWTHGPASEEFPLALVRIALRNAEDSPGVAEWIRRDGYTWMPVAQDGFGLDPSLAGGVMVGLVPADLPTVLERFLRRLFMVEGVAHIQRTFALGSAMYPAWFADRIAGLSHDRG
jgi:DNA-binding Lrp family transcriptional regulator